MTDTLVLLIGVGVVIWLVVRPKPIDDPDPSPFLAGRPRRQGYPLPEPSVN